MNNIKKNLIFIFTFFIYLSFFLGFYFGENSIGSGGYNGDLTWMWNNFDIFKSNDLWVAINHEDFFGNRTPLLYLLHILFNPLIYDIDLYRLSVFCLSFIGPIIFYLCLKQKFKDTDKYILFFISSFILLSPYYRTSAYWGLEINYGLISMLLSIFFLNCTLDEKNNNTKLYFNLFLTTLFSSLCIYFDQKLLIIPLICVFKILVSKINLRFKLFTLINYFILAIPFIYLIFSWKGIVPQATQEGNPDAATHISGLNLHFFHLGYATTLMAFYLLPLLFLKQNNIINVFREFFSNNKNIYKVLVFFIYLFYLIFFNNFEEFTVDKQHKTINGVFGLGFIHKVSLILFSTLVYQEIFTYFSFFISWIIVLIFIQNKMINFLIIIYFYLISLLLFPLMQEYFDPYIILFALLLFNFQFDLKYIKVVGVSLYLIIFLVSANIYYFTKIL